MSIMGRSILVAAIALLFVSCTAPAPVQPTVQGTHQPVQPTTIQLTSTTLPAAKIARYPEPADFSQNYMRLDIIPKYDPTSDNPFQIDLRSRDLSQVDMTESLDDLLYATFDSKTQWPVPDKLPADFDWQAILEFGKNPGLGVRSLHEEGITGKDVNIAIIDQPLIIDHGEYPDRIRLYEEINVVPDTPSQVHGPGVTSIAVGKTAGIAPDANVFYIAAFNFDPHDPEKEVNYSYLAKGIHRILEINKQLPEDQKIRAISMSTGLNPDYKGYDESIAAINKAKEAGIFPSM